MTKTEDLVITPPPPAVKPGRHVAAALNHLNKQRDGLLKKRDKIDSELESINAAIQALR